MVLGDTFQTSRKTGCWKQPKQGVVMSRIFLETLGLMFEDPERDDSPLLVGPPRALIYVKTFTSNPSLEVRWRGHTLTPLESDPDKFDAHADRLIESIKKLKKQARQKFERAKTLSTSVRCPKNTKARKH